MKPVVSCVILNYNDAGTTIELVESIKNFENIDYIVIVDNDSTDNSMDIISPHASDKIKIVQTGKNGGYGFGNNIGILYSHDILQATHAIIANPDVAFDKDMVQKLIETFDDKMVAIASARQAGNHQRGWKNCSAMDHILTTSLIFEEILKIRTYPDKYYEGKSEVPIFAVPGSLLMVDIAKMIQCDMYDEDIFLFHEEFVLAEKLQKFNYKTILRLDTSYTHKRHSTLKKNYSSWTRFHALQLESAKIFLSKYKKISFATKVFSRIWFAYSKLEFVIYSVYRNFKDV